MDKYAFTIDADESTFTLPYSRHELTFLGGKGGAQIAAFRAAVGLWDNFRVATGMNTGAWTTKNRADLLTATIGLGERLGSQWELYSQDYWYQLPGSGSRSRRMCPVDLETGTRGYLYARYPGQLYVDATDSGHGIVDLRTKDSFLAVSIGTIRIYRKRNDLRWPSLLQRLADFLQRSDGASIRIRHHYANLQQPGRPS